MDVDKDWGTYRKLFDHPSPDFVRLPFMTRAVAAELLRHCDRAGRLVPAPARALTEKLVADLAFHVRAHPHETGDLHKAIDWLLQYGDDGKDEPYLVFRGGFLVIRNFVKAQRSESAERMARKRERDAEQPSKLKTIATTRGGVTVVTPSTSRDARDGGDASDERARLSSRVVSSDLFPNLDPEPVGKTLPDDAREETTGVRATVKIPCPADLALTPEQRATLETALIPSHALEPLTLRFVSKAVADPTDKRTLASWRKCLAISVQSDWNNPRVRAEVGPKPPGLVEHERRQAEAARPWIPPPNGGRVTEDEPRTRDGPSPIAAVLGAVAGQQAGKAGRP